MSITRMQTDELKELSLYLFGTSSRWKKLVEKGAIVDDVDEKGEKVQKLKKYSELEILFHLRQMKADIEQKKLEEQVQKMAGGSIK